MLYAINLIRGGFWVGLLSFFIWSLPGAIGAYGLGIGVSRIGDTLPNPVYALLSGLNGATVGIIALAAVQLSDKAITDRITMVLVFLGGTAGMLYTALWYYPVLMFSGGCATVIWDLGSGQRALRVVKAKVSRRKHAHMDGDEEQRQAIELHSNPQPEAERNTNDSNVAIRRGASSATEHDTRDNKPVHDDQSVNEPQARTTPQPRAIPWKVGVTVIGCFFVTFITTMTLRGTLDSPPRGFRLFANLYLAGTIIFGGGPVVIPLLREYVVAEGWVSSRDFLLGLAIIQAFPGPNFNFAVYLGTLAVGRPDRLNPAAGAAIGFVSIFAPGLILHTGTMGVWDVLRRYRWATSAIRGINATAVGLIYTAVYRLWEIGYVGADFKSGSPLGGDPWWVVVTATSFVGGRWFGVSAPVAILLGGVMGMVWYGIVSD
ncbi:MAG: hypothetical protein Q9163_002728 [Psora crenata]